MTVTKRGRIEIDASVKGEGEIRSAGASMAKMETHLGSMGKSMVVANLASGALAAGFAALSRGMGDVIATSLNFEDWVGKGSKALDGMSTAVDGMIGKLALSRAETKLTTGDFKANERQLQAVAKASVLLARINKEDFAPSLKAVTKSIISGSDKALRDLGINVELTGTKVEKSAKALKLIEERFGDVNIQASNTNEQLEKMKSNLDNAVGYMGAAILKTDLFKGAIKGLTAAMEGFSHWMSRSETEKTRIELSELRKEIGRIQSGDTSKDNWWMQLVSDRQLGLAILPELIKKEQELKAKLFNLDPSRGVGEGPTKRVKGRGPVNEREIFRDKDGKRLSESDRLEARFKKFGTGGNHVDFPEGENGMAASRWELDKSVALMKESEALSVAANAWGKYEQATNKAFNQSLALANQTEELNGVVTQLGSGLLNNVAGGFLDIAAAAAAGEQNIGQMALAMLKGITLGLAKQLFALGITYQIKGAAAAATLIESGLAPGYFAASNLAFAGAATVGAIGIGVSALGGAISGGGGGGGGRSSSPSGGGSTFRPTVGSTTSRDQQVRQVFEVHIGALDALSSIAFKKTLTKIMKP